MKIRTLLLALIALGVASEARAQFDAPAFLPPRPGDDVGVYLSDVADFGIQGIWRQRGNLNLGLRLGYIDGYSGGALSVGVETWGMVLNAGEELPVDVGWTLAGGGVFGDNNSIEIPAGITIGRVVQLETLTLQPYAHPRVALFFFTDAPDDSDDVELEVLFDLGIEAVLNEDFKLRFAAT
ncbi:MAG: hypothetical protein P8177_08005, partial [Gemmatimonadota bacterium]